MLNRRDFAIGAAAVLATPPLCGMIGRRQNIWIGSCAKNGENNGIYHCWLDVTKGTLSEPVLAAATEQPSFFCTMLDSQNRLILYSVNEVARREGSVASFVVGDKAGTLTPWNRVGINNVGPTYISACPATRTLYTANYTGSSLSVLRVDPDGRVSEVIQRFDTKEVLFGTSGTHPEQGVSHPHSVTLSPNNRFVLVNDLGDDSIDIFAVENDGKLSEQPVLVKVPPQAGPRHLAFHPNRQWVYGLNELNATLRQYAWTENNSSANLKYMDRSVPTIDPRQQLPAGTRVRAAEVEISPDGRFLYTCTRGDNSITVFTIAKHDGELTFRQRIGCGGTGPRQFKLDLTAGWIVCCNTSSSNVTLFRRNMADGTLTGPVQMVKVDAAEFALFT